MSNPVDVGATTPLARSRGHAPTNNVHVLVIEAGSSTVVPLSVPGIVTIGRGVEADLRADHSSVSRRHARIVVERDGILVNDLGSHNGTRVNGELLRDARLLFTGDVIAVGEVLLVVHAELAHDLAPADAIDDKSWRRRLAEEVERATAFRRSLAVMAINDARPSSACWRAIDVVGEAGGQITVCLPEADASVASAVAARVREECPAARIGLALCPDDAIDPESLVTLARTAAQAAAPGEIGTVLDAAEHRTLGDRTIVVRDPAMVRVFELLKRLGNSELPVLIVGETGVGKEAAAAAVHHHSRRNGGPFVAVNCAALSDTLIDSQLFGHDKGAFTGATAARPGVFETASGGTLFLDELGELSVAAQAKLLRAIETQRIIRLGETRERQVDVRIVAATHRNLPEEVTAGRFRQDLYFRLGAARVHIPPLRERRCEIALLFRELLAAAAARVGRNVPTPSPLVMQRILGHAWPGNVRELRHIAEYLLAVVEDDRIEPDDLPDDFTVETPVLVAQLASVPDGVAPMRKLSDELEELERKRMSEALMRTNGVKTRAAALLGMPIRTFNAKFKQYAL